MPARNQDILPTTVRPPNAGSAAVPPPTLSMAPPTPPRETTLGDPVSTWVASGTGQGDAVVRSDVPAEVPDPYVQLTSAKVTVLPPTRPAFRNNLNTGFLCERTCLTTPSIKRSFLFFLNSAYLQILAPEHKSLCVLCRHPTKSLWRTWAACPSARSSPLLQRRAPWCYAEIQPDVVAALLSLAVTVR